jgi:hypothetical protein
VSFRREDRLLFACLRGAGDPRAADVIGVLARGSLHWREFASTAVQNDVGPIVRVQLQKAGVWDQVPSWAARQLEQEYYRVGVRNTRYFAELGRLLDSLHQCGINVIVLKGAALAEAVWKNIALRPMGDIDLLAREDDLDGTDRVLRRLGYDQYLDESRREEYRANGHHLAPYFNARSRIIVEVHHNILTNGGAFRTAFDVRNFWERAHRARIGGVETSVLSTEDTVIHLCLHQCKHEGPSREGLFLGKLKNLMDLSGLIADDCRRIRWDIILNEARERGVARYVYYPLYFAQRLLAAGVPRDMLKQLKRESQLTYFADALLKRIIGRNLFLGREDLSIIPRRILVWLFEELLRTTLLESVRSVLRRACFPPPKESLAESPGPSESFLKGLVCVSRRLRTLGWRAVARMARVAVRRATAMPGR